MNQFFRPIIILFLISIFWISDSCKLYADTLERFDLTEIVIEFSNKEMSLKQFLDELYQHPELTIVYGNKDLKLDIPLKLSAQRMNVKKALEEVELQAPVDFTFNNTHIIVKSRPIEKSYKITGTLRDASTKQGLIAAGVFIAGTTTGALTDNNGNFSIVLEPGVYKLIFRYIGYEEKSRSVNLFQNISIVDFLDEKQNQIDAVVVNGNFNLIESLEVGRTIETINSKTINRLNTNDVNDALHGRLNGVWTTKVSGAPGDHHKIRIRGISSIFGATDPLYVVDGAIVPIVNFENLGIADLNSNDVESITILKDASSTALYGNLGSNGVVVIETKKGGGKPKFNFRAKQGFQKLSKRYDLLNAEDFLSNLALSDKLIKTKFYKVNPTIKKYELYPTYNDSLGNALPEKDYQEELFRTGTINEYQLSSTGNYKTIDYYLSGNYYNHNGVIENTNYKKYTFTANLSKVVDDKYFVRLLYKGSHQENKNTLDNYLGNNIIFKGINYEPAYAATPDSFLKKDERLFYQDYISTSIQALSNHQLSPDSLFYGSDKIKLDNANSLNLQGYYQLNKQFSLRAIASLSARNLTFTSMNSPNSFSGKQFLKSSEDYIYFNSQIELNYKKQFKNHQINSFIRYRGYIDNVKWQVDSLNGVKYDGIKPEDEIFLRGSQAIYGEIGAVMRSIQSGIFNLNYNYKRKYFISMISNYEKLIEGSSARNGELFKSIAFNYDLSKEGILRLPKWINSFNLYMNLGESGNYPLNSLSDNLYSGNSNYTSNNTVVPGVYVTNLSNKKIHPEKVSETNYGAKFSLFNDRLLLSADCYKKVNNELLIKRTIPLYYGGGFIFQNIGEMKNSGYELSLEIIPLNSENLFWSCKAGLSSNKQFITKLDEGKPITFNNTDILIPDFVAVENEALGAITGYKYLGKWEDYNVKEYGKLHPDYVENKGLAYARNDTIIASAIKQSDKMIIGNSLPDYTFNFVNFLEYKNFTCEMLWYGVVGVEKFNATKASTFITGLNTEVKNIVLDTMNYITSNVFYESSYFLEDASFIRLKTLSFSYRQPKKIASRISLEYTLSFENLITLTNYSGYDPEAAIYTNNNFTDNAIDRGAYPNPRGFYFSINMNF